MDRSRFRGAIFRKYRSISAFTSDIGWPKNKAHNIIDGKYTPDVDECAEFASILGLDSAEYMQIFAPFVSPNGDTKPLS